MTYRILALDLSVSSTGYASPYGILGRIKAPAGLEPYTRLINVTDRILDLVTESRADLVVVEDYAPRSLGVLSTIRSAELGGVIRRELERSRVDWLAVKPNTLKLWATGKGNAKKPAMIARALELGATLSTSKADDEADAYLLRAMALEALHGPDNARALGYGIDWRLPRRPGTG